MTFSILSLIRELVAPYHHLSCSKALWRAGLAELARRGVGQHESGAFVLGERRGDRRVIKKFIYYDDLDRHCLDTGIVVFDGAGYGPLWKLCRESGLDVVADIHTHGGTGSARQSSADRNNPMVAVPGHIALIVPRFAQLPWIRQSEIGIYEYTGQHKWKNHCGEKAVKFFYIGFFG